MKNTADFLDALRVKFDLPSDGALGRFLGITHRQQMSWYRNMRGTFDDELSLKVADLLELDPAYVVACMHAQREKNDQVRKVWERIASMAVAASVVFAVAGLALILSGSAFSLEGVGYGLSVASAGFTRSIHYAYLEHVRHGIVTGIIFRFTYSTLPAVPLLAPCLAVLRSACPGPM
jgi:hypothetical protein